jgi:hypothetical protein
MSSCIIDRCQEMVGYFVAAHTANGARLFRARSSMSDDRGGDGLIDVSGLTIEELSAVVGESGLERALDYILAAGDNSVGFHGFNSRI